MGQYMECLIFRTEKGILQTLFKVWGRIYVSPKSWWDDAATKGGLAVYSCCIAALRGACVTILSLF
ncbi:hypothetical protein MCP1_40014 [Candidatus Terasakiella magnetica]|nr:hypothetical protein MCP1_40014 [Candidatus Terasakiella magnetica]